MKEDKANLGLYYIQLAGMSIGAYEFDFVIDDALLVKYENEDISNLRAEAMMQLTHRPNVMEVKIQLKGSIDLLCDRCLSPFAYDFELEEVAVLKQASKSTDAEINIIIFEPEKGIVEFDQYIYDMLITALPMQRTHPDERQCDQDMIKRIMTKNNIEKGIDPRWNDLQNLI